jgi:hypothetical protein
MDIKTHKKSQMFIALKNLTFLIFQPLTTHFQCDPTSLSMYNK